MKKLSRFLQHAFTMPWQVQRIFSRTVCQSIEHAITNSEQSHRAEIRFVVEAAFDSAQLLRNVSVRERAVELFSQLRIWDTEHNTGVLVYALFAERQLEIVADRGISARVTQEEWDAICAGMASDYREGKFGIGTIAGLKKITALLDQHFPETVKANANELSNQVILL